jgi:hypothetical protein
MALASNNNLVFIDECKGLQNLRVDLAVDEDLVTYQDQGFSLQLNAFPQPGQFSQGSELNWFQYVLYVQGQTAWWEIQYWSVGTGTWAAGVTPVPGTSPWLPVFPNDFELTSFGSVPLNRIPLGSLLTIALTTDSNANVVQADFSVNTPASGVLSATFPFPSGTQYPICAFTVNLVGPGSLANTTFISGVGTFKYSVSPGTLSPQSGGIGSACGEAGPPTGETSNATYGPFGPDSGPVVMQTLSFSWQGTAASASSALNGYWGTDGSQHVNFLDINGHVHELYILPGQGWVDNDLTQMANAPPATSGSALTGYWNFDEAQYVYYTDDLGHVHQLYIGPGLDWLVIDYTKATRGVPAIATSTLSAYPDIASGDRYVNFLDINGHVHELYLQSGGASEVDGDLTELSNGTPAMPTSGVCGYYDGLNGRHVNFIDQNGHVHELYTHPGSPWADDDLTGIANGTPAAIPTPTRPGHSQPAPSRSFVRSYWVPDNTQHVNFIDANGHVHELYTSPATPWRDNDLTALTDSKAAMPGSALSSYWSGDRGQHVNYIDVEGHVHELTKLSETESWVHTDLTYVTSAMPAALSSPLDSYILDDETLHVNFIDLQGHVHELYGDRDGSWVDHDLSAKTL